MTAITSLATKLDKATMHQFSKSHPKITKKLESLTNVERSASNDSNISDLTDFSSLTEFSSKPGRDKGTGKGKGTGSGKGKVSPTKKPALKNDAGKSGRPSGLGTATTATARGTKVGGLGAKTQTQTKSSSTAGGSTAGAGVGGVGVGGGGVEEVDEDLSSITLEQATLSLAVLQVPDWNSGFQEAIQSEKWQEKVRISKTNTVGIGISRN